MLCQQLPEKKLSEAERQWVITLRMEGYSIAEVAKMINRSKSYVKDTWAKRHWPSLKKRKTKSRKLTPAANRLFQIS